jgi:NADPH:quinone reductase-like Zn-dependent oxidoreductase
MNKLQKISLVNAYDSGNTAFDVENEVVLSTVKTSELVQELKKYGADEIIVRINNRYVNRINTITSEANYEVKDKSESNKGYHNVVFTLVKAKN